MSTKLTCWMLVVALSASVMACGEEDTPGGDFTGEDVGLSDAGDTGDGDDADASGGDVDLDDAGDAPDGGDETDGGTDSDDAGDTVPTNIQGVWAAKMVTSGIAQTPIGESQSDTVSILRMDVSQDGQNLTVLSETCDVTIDGESAGVAPVIPDALVDSLPISERSGTYVDGNLVLPTIYEVRGAQNFDDLQNDALPENSDDPRVYDQDEDGNPGVTVSVEGFISGDIYLVQRSSNALVGSAGDAGQIEGRVTWSDEQSILGSSNQLLTSFQPESVPNSDPDASYFEMVPVDGSLDCDTIAGQADTLFSR